MKNAKKENFFIVAVEGATTDGRNIERVWIEQMAKDYDPSYHTALINLEHIKHQSPSSVFCRYGEVTALKTQELSSGKLAGKLALLAQINPTPQLLELHKQRQKLFASVEINLNFAGTDRAYLVGLGFTDDPASLGVEVLNFSASKKINIFKDRKAQDGNLFSAAEFELELTAEEAQSKAAQEYASLSGKLSQIIKQINQIFNNKDHSLYKELAADFGDLNAATKRLNDFYIDISEQQAQKIEQLSARIKRLEEQPATAPRLATAGGFNDYCTDC